MPKYLKYKSNILAFFAHYKNVMVYVFSLLAGFVNGFFASGAGQILVFYLIYILKEETHESRMTSVCCIGLVTIFTIVRYLRFVQINWMHVIITVLCGILFGLVGSKLMQKIPSKFLNILSGIIIIGLSIYNLVVM